MQRDVKVGVAAAVIAGAVVAIVVAACLPDPDRPPTGGAQSAIPCDGGGPGNFPIPNCDPTPNNCPSAQDPSCVIAAHCGSTQTCLPLSDNSTKATLDLRISKLYATAPPELTVSIIQNSIITSGVDLNAPECGENGKGSFNWLLRIDKTAGTLTTGGAVPAIPGGPTDPFTQGFCFYKAQSDGGLNVGPVTSKVDFASDGSFSSQPVDLLNVPIFVDPKDLTSVVILPLRKAVVKSATLSMDGNCIGSFNAPSLGPNCNNWPPPYDKDNCSRWHTGGTIGGFITLEDADQVRVDLLSESLCVLLSQTPKGTDNKCTRTGGKIDAKGDFCSTTQQAGGCQDSFWLSATFTASAVLINDGAGIQGCGVTPVVDAGPDSSDSGSSDATGD